MSQSASTPVHTREYYERLSDRDLLSLLANRGIPIYDGTTREEAIDILLSAMDFQYQPAFEAPPYPLFSQVLPSVRPTILQYPGVSGQATVPYLYR